jgi:hypothetical protein
MLCLATMWSGACQRQAPVAETHSAAPSSPGHLAGTVKASDAGATVSGRTVAVVNVATGERRTTETTATGGFTIDVPAGNYRVELALRDGEAIVNQPDVVSPAYGGSDSHIELILAPAKVQRPRGPAYRLDNGLGSPIA